MLLDPIIAGDGHAYFAYTYQNETTVSQTTREDCGVSTTITATDTVLHFMVMRVGADGSSSQTDVHDWESRYLEVASNASSPYTHTYSNIGAIPSLYVQMITNADQGMVFGWEADTPDYCASGKENPRKSCYADVPAASTYGFGSNTTPSAVWPVLQAQDGTFYGASSSNNSAAIVKFDQSGNVNWIVPGDSPKIATADGGVVGSSGITYDANGNATGQIPMPIQSWSQTTFQYGSVEETANIPVAPATPQFWSFDAANESLNLTSPLCHDSRDQLIAEYGKRSVPDIPPYQRFTPSCFLATNSAHSFYYQFSDLNKACQSQKYTPEFPWALIKFPLIAPSTNGYGLDAWRENYGSSRTINTAYRDPVQNVKCGSVSPGSRHQFGDAVDLANEADTVQEWQDMVNAAKAARADYIEKPTESKAKACQTQHVDPNGVTYIGCIGWVHADWRRHDRGKYNGPTFPNTQ